jgi:hypothetical protein
MCMYIYIYTPVYYIVYVYIYISIILYIYIRNNPRFMIHYRKKSSDPSGSPWWSQIILIFPMVFLWVLGLKTGDHPNHAQALFHAQAQWGPPREYSSTRRPPGTGCATFSHSVCRSFNVLTGLQERLTGHEGSPTGVNAGQLQTSN